MMGLFMEGKLKGVKAYLMETLHERFRSQVSLMNVPVLNTRAATRRSC